jgi:gliding motility-associated-like protein
MLTISQLGCVDTVQYTIDVFDEPYVPTAISPNGDGVNDFLKIPFLSGYPENEVYIYNRWGKRVYEATNYKDDWAAENLPSGTYFYVVTAPTLEMPLKGALNVFKED